MVENIETSKESGTITIKKDSLWKYATFLLIAVVVVGGFFMLRGGSTGGAATGDNNSGTSGIGDVSVFLNNPELYPSIGPDNAPHTVIEFADFQCPYCALASGLPSWASQYQQYADLIGSAGKVETLAEQGKVKFVFVIMNFLDRGNVGESNWAGEAALCANSQGKFWEMHDAIYKASDGPSEETGKYSVANLEKIAQGISGLDQTKFKDCLEKGTYLSAVQTSNAAAGTAGVQGTPTFVVDGKQVQASWTAIQAAIGQ